MSLSYDFCRARASEAASLAGETALPNVRERALRSEAAWLEMAGRERLVQQTREKAKREKDAALAAAEADA